MFTPWTRLEDWTRSLTSEPSNTYRLLVAQEQLKLLADALIRNLVEKKACVSSLGTTNVCEVTQHCNEVRRHDQVLACTLSRDILPALENLLFLLQTTEEESREVYELPTSIFLTSAADPGVVCHYSLASLKYNLESIGKIEDQLGA